MGASESAYCEISEILEMMPANEDAYIVLRMGSANTTADDGDGHDTASPKNISDDLYRHGMIYNGARSAVRSEDTYINRNPIYMTARKVAHDRLRMVERASLKGYEVSGGKSILYYDRKARGVSGADIFGGIAPSETAIPSGNIKHNQKYVVSSGTSGITYNGSAVAVGSTFTGAKGQTTFTTTSGDEVVKEYDGIIETAGEAGFDNRWCMYMSTTTYKPAEGSAFKPNSYGDIMGHGVDRCTFYSQTWTDITSAEGKEMLQHVSSTEASHLLDRKIQVVIDTPLELIRRRQGQAEHLLPIVTREVVTLAEVSHRRKAIAKALLIITNPVKFTFQITKLNLQRLPQAGL
jgi:hypothetical protein